MKGSSNYDRCVSEAGVPKQLCFRSMFAETALFQKQVFRNSIVSETGFPKQHCFRPAVHQKQHRFRNAPLKHGCFGNDAPKQGCFRNRRQKRRVRNAKRDPKENPPGKRPEFT
eukprot:3206861-Alexandrium_andersonii.AAC.1